MQHVVECEKNLDLKVESAIQIQYTFFQSQRLSSHGPLAVLSVCVLRKRKKKLAFVHSPGSWVLEMGNKQSDCAVKHFSSQSATGEPVAVGPMSLPLLLPAALPRS